MERDIYVVIEHLQGKINDISYVMCAAAKSLASSGNRRVVGVLMGSHAEHLAEDLAVDTVLYFDHPALAEFNPDPYQRTLAKVIQEENPSVVIFGSTSIGADIAGVLSARLGLPQVSACQSFLPGNKYQSKICGGKIMVEGGLPEITTLITFLPGGYNPDDGKGSIPPEIINATPPDLSDLRVTLRAYIPPDTSDVDISKERFLVAVGRGIQTQDNLELAEELAELFNGAVCASRPVVDQGWLPTTRLVGRSGKSVKPDVYLALGISGAPEHVEGISQTKTIIAINTDPNAPIFDIADYGAEVDALDLLEILIEELEEMKV